MWSGFVPKHQMQGYRARFNAVKPLDTTPAKLKHGAQSRFSGIFGHTGGQEAESEDGDASWRSSP